MLCTCWAVFGFLFQEQTFDDVFHSVQMHLIWCQMGGGCFFNMVICKLTFDVGDPNFGFEQLNCDGRFCADYIGGTSWCLTDWVTGAKCELQGQHDLVFSYGLTLLRNPKTDEQLEPALLLMRALVRDNSGDVWLCQVTKGEDKAVQ